MAMQEEREFSRVSVYPLRSAMLPRAGAHKAKITVICERQDWP
jgi:hypothetical protein